MYEQRYPEVDDVVMVQVRLRSRRPRPPSRQHWRRVGRLPPSLPPFLAGFPRAAAETAPAFLQVKSIAEMGAYVSLLEYNNIEGMILLSELSRRRIRSVTKLIKARTLAWPPASRLLPH
jgi:hypothetical protein